MDDEFGFLLCEWCQRDVKDPKLLPCLHNVCTECLGSLGLCPICKTPHSQNAGTPKEDNVLFRNLQAKLSIFQKVADGKGMMCNNCQNEAEFWCFDCSEFFCVSCYGFHQKLLKQDNHQAKSLKDLKAESSNGFLAWIRKLSNVTCSNHKDQPLSRYCPECKKSMCITCELLDSKHVGQHFAIKREIQQRQSELLSLSSELKRKKSNYSDNCESLKTLLQKKEKAMNETRNLFKKLIKVIMQQVQEKGETLLREVENQHNQEVQDIKVKVDHMEGMLKRMKSTERLVEKMSLYALGQEMIDMHPFIRKSLEELKKKQPPTVDYEIQTKNLTQVKSQFQALCERVTGQKVAPAILQQAFTQNCSVKSPAKRKNVQEKKSAQTPLKVIKNEPNGSEWKTPAIQGSWGWIDQPGPSSAPAGGSCAGGSGLEKAINTNSWVPSPIPQSNVNCYSQLTGASNCIKDCAEEDSSDDEFLDASLLEETNDKLESSQTEASKYSFSSPVTLNSGQETLVFFDMKNLPGKIFHLVAVRDNLNSFSVTIQPQPILDRGDVRTTFCEHGLDSFLSYLKTLHMPILVGYNLWSMDLPTLVNSLEAINKEERFESTIFGFLDAFPLIKQIVPDASSYTLKNLHRTYISGQMDDTQALACANAVNDLCTVLGVNQMIPGERVIPYSSLRCYVSLQVLLREKLLSKVSAKTLVLHNVDLSKLQLVYQDNVAFGLQRFCQALNSNLRNGEKKIKNLSRVRSYFQARSFTNLLYSSAAHN